MTSDPEALARLAFELVAVASVTGEEAALADLLEARCRALPGVAVERLGNSLVARVGEREDAVALVGHLDTVPPWEHHEPELQGPRVIGRGAADMKGGDAAILAVLEDCARTRADVVCVLYDREEDQPPERHPRSARGFAPARPAGLRVRGRADGLRHPRRVRRRAQRRSRLPWPHRAQRTAVEGESAVLKAVPFLERAAATAQRPVEVEGLTFYDTLCITQIQGGIARNVVPDRLEIALNARFAPGREAADVRREIEELVAGEGELAWIDASPAAPPRLSEPVLARFLAETGVRVLPKQAWTDVASLQARGIPAANYGPGEAHQAHQPGEWVDGEAIAQVASTLARFLQTR